MYRIKKKDSPGSLTVEASISLTFFLGLFMLLLFFIQFSCTEIYLDTAVNEAAKQLATAAYPISFLNELEDDVVSEYGSVDMPTLEEELDRIPGYAGINTGEDIINILLSGKSDNVDVNKVINKVLEDYKKGIIGELTGRASGEYWKIKAAVKYNIARQLMADLTDSPLIDKTRLTINLVELPQSNAEYEARKNSGYSLLGLIPGEDFDRDDVVIQIEYDYKVSLPFYKYNIKMIHTAVERAWLNGSNGVITVKDEGLELFPKGKTVYVTKTGKKYHAAGCRYLRYSSVPIGIDVAREMGYGPCKICNPK